MEILEINTLRIAVIHIMETVKFEGSIHDENGKLNQNGIELSEIIIGFILLYNQKSELISILDERI